MPRFGKPVSSFGGMSLTSALIAFSKATNGKGGNVIPPRTSGSVRYLTLSRPVVQLSVAAWKAKANAANRPPAATPTPAPSTSGSSNGTSSNSDEAAAHPGATDPTNGNSGNAAQGNGNASNAGQGNGNAGNAGQGNGNAGNAAQGNGNAGNAAQGNGNAGNAAQGNGNATNGNATNGNASNGNTANGNASNAGQGNGNASNAGQGNGNAGNAGQGNGNAGNAGQGSGNASTPPRALPPGWSIVTWEPPGLTRKEDGGLPPGLADRLTDDLGLPPGLSAASERGPVRISAEQSTGAPLANPRTALRLQMQRAATRYATMSALTQIAAAQNERAITASMGRPAPLDVFFGWLRIR